MATCAAQPCRGRASAHSSSDLVRRQKKLVAEKGAQEGNGVCLQQKMHQHIARSARSRLFHTERIWFQTFRPSTPSLLSVVCDSRGATHHNLCASQCVNAGTVTPGACASANDCPAGCARCRAWATDTCVQCVPGLVQFDGQCVAACPAGFAALDAKYGPVCMPAAPAACGCPLDLRPGEPRLTSTTETPLWCQERGRRRGELKELVAASCNQSQPLADRTTQHEHSDTAKKTHCDPLSPFPLSRSVCQRLVAPLSARSLRQGWCDTCQPLRSTVPWRGHGCRPWRLCDRVLPAGLLAMPAVGA